MRHFRLLSLALLLAGCFEAADTPTPETIADPEDLTELTPPGLPELVVAAAEAAVGEQIPPAPASFDVDQHRSLYVYARVRNLVGQHKVRVEVLSPDGHVYEVIERRFTMSEAIATATDRTGGPGPRSAAPGGLALQLPAKVMVAPWSRVFWWRLPVSGTPILEQQMIGTWRLRAFLDGEQSPSAVADFSLTRAG